MPAQASDAEAVVADAAMAAGTQYQGPPGYVYALGQIEPRFPSLAIEKEFSQAASRLPYEAGLTDRQVFKRAISNPQNRYLARRLCWVFVIAGIETYIVIPRDVNDLDLLLDSYREAPQADDLDVVIGRRMMIAPPEMCNGLALPVVIFEQLYSFDRAALVEAIPNPEEIAASDRAKFRAAAGELLNAMIRIGDNAGATDDHRAINYLAVRYPGLYSRTALQFNRNFSFAGVEVRRSPLSGARSVVDVIASYRHRETDVEERHAVRVDVTEEFPFLVRPISPHYDL